MGYKRIHRIKENLILKDLKKKIVLLTGPRQVGKTWLAKKIMQSYKKPFYLNYDSFKDQKMIHEQSWLEDTDLIVFDEIHKMDQWKNYIKGVFDTRPSHRHILVTGSARLQQMSRSGDSLVGRYFSHTLLPFSLFELQVCYKSVSPSRFIRRGGFPEPLFISKDNEEVERWREQYMFSLLREDIPDFKNIQNYKKMETLLYLLKEGVGSPLSIQSLSESLKLDHKTVSRYISILENLFIIFQVSPFSKKINRSLYKSKKVYFYDFGFIDSSDKGKRLENLVALHLFKYCLYTKETTPSVAPNLYYLRTKDQREVDFLLTRKTSPLLMVEVKAKTQIFSKNLLYFHDRYGISGKQLCLNLERAQKNKGRQVVLQDLEKFLMELKV